LIIHYEFQSSFAVKCNVVAFLYSRFWQQYVYKNHVLLCEERNSAPLIVTGRWSWSVCFRVRWLSIWLATPGRREIMHQNQVRVVQ